MIINIRLLSAAVALAWPLRAVAQDPVAVSPGQYKIRLENEYARVVEYSVKPGERDQPHTHPPKVIYVLNGGTLRIFPEGADSFVSEEKEGTATFMGPVPRHYTENVGKTAVRNLVVEIKRVDQPQAPHDQDPAVVNPSSIKVLLENDSVRVMEAVLPPGFKERQHTHPPYLFYVIAGGSVRNHLADGTVRDVELSPGQISFTNPVTHWAENTGTSTLHFVLVEIRSRNKQ